AFETLCGVSLAGGYLRVEYCLDSKGFWLEPHTDIGAKLFTHLIYLSTGPGSEAWGTDLLRPDGELVARAPATPNSGLIFIPASDSWHGFAPRPIEGVRRTLIVNYVREEWRARHELCFPEQPVGRAR
ncbi:MAG: 2OG-Fe(II) oxygenase, partial [Elsteraceae bacterium]